jgi:hypothetical protein
MAKRKGPTKEMLESFNKDKAVQDMIVESWVCVDCGVNTAPGFPSGPEAGIAFARGAKRVPQRFDRETEVYHVKDKIWKQAGMKPWGGCLCVGCLERRIGRQLRPKDFAQHDLDVWSEQPCTDRLLNRRGFAWVTVRTKDGPEQVICCLQDATSIEALVSSGAVMITSAE